MAKSNTNVKPKANVMATSKKKEGSKVITATEDREKRNRKKASNLKGMEKGMASGMTKGDQSSEQPAR